MLHLLGRKFFPVSGRRNRTTARMKRETELRNPRHQKRAKPTHKVPQRPLWGPSWGEACLAVDLRQLAGWAQWPSSCRDKWLRAELLWRLHHDGSDSGGNSVLSFARGGPGYLPPSQTEGQRSMLESNARQQRLRYPGAVRPSPPVSRTIESGLKTCSRSRSSRKRISPPRPW